MEILLYGPCCTCNVLPSIGKFYESNQCSKVLSYSSPLQRNGKTHIGRESDKCEPQTKGLNYHKYVQKHRRTNNKVDSYECNKVIIHLELIALFEGHI